MQRMQRKMVQVTPQPQKVEIELEDDVSHDVSSLVIDK